MKMKSRQTRIFADICLIMIYNEGSKTHKQLHEKMEFLGYANVPKVNFFPQLLKYFPYFEPSSDTEWKVSNSGIIRIQNLKENPPYSRVAKIPKIQD